MGSPPRRPGLRPPLPPGKLRHRRRRVPRLATPVLISDKVNIHEEVLADNAGLTAPDTLAGTIDLLTRWQALTPTQRAELSTNARTCFLTRYDMQTNAQSILRIFTELRTASNRIAP